MKAQSLEHSLQMLVVVPRLKVHIATSCFNRSYFLPNSSIVGINLLLIFDVPIAIYVPMFRELDFSNINTKGVLISCCYIWNFVELYLSCLTGVKKEKPTKRRRRKRRKLATEEVEDDNSEAAFSPKICSKPSPLDEPLSIPAALFGNS